MSREIKFRVWVESLLEEETGMYIPDYISSWQNGTNWDIDKVYTRMREPGGYKFKEDTCKFTLMQYTGLKDKNGVEIYEGDILHTENPSDTVKVWYMAPQYLLKSMTNKGSYDMSDWGAGEEVSELEVIGNIYDDPELLTNNL